MSEPVHFLEDSARHSKNVIQHNSLGEIKFINGVFAMKFLFRITGAEGSMGDEDAGRGVVHYKFGKKRVLFTLKFSL